MSIEEVKKGLMGIQSGLIRVPNVAMAVAVQEANDLLALARKPSVKEALIAVGEGPAFDVDLADRIQVARESQSAWVTVREQTKSAQLIELEDQAARLRSEFIAAGRFNLRGDREASATLTTIGEGEGLADLVQDLFDLAALYETRLGAFASDKSFDAPAKIALARELGQSLSADTSTEKLDGVPGAARELRNRAFTYLDDRVAEIRTAGRYAFRDQPALLKRFTSEHQRRLRQRRSSRDEAAAAATPPATTVVANLNAAAPDNR